MYDDAGVVSLAIDPFLLKYLLFFLWWHMSVLPHVCQNFVIFPVTFLVSPLNRVVVSASSQTEVREVHTVHIEGE